MAGRPGELGRSGAAMIQLPADRFRNATATALPSQGVMTAGLFALMMAGFLDTVFTSDPANPVDRRGADRDDEADALVWLTDGEPEIPRPAA